MNVNATEKSANPRGRLVRSRKVIASVVSRTPFGLAGYAVVKALFVILRITEDEVVRITEDGQERCIERAQ